MIRSQFISISGCLVFLSKKVLDLDGKMALLLSDNGRGWNEELVMNSFDEGEVGVILSIPLGSCGQMDIRVWTRCDSGLYCV